MTPSVEAPPSPGFPRLLAAASLLIPLTFFGTVAWQTYQEQRAAFAEEASWTARLLQEHAQRLMRGYQSALRLVHYQIEQGGLPAADGPDDLQDFLRALAESSDALEAIAVADRDGHVLVADVPLSSPQSSIANREYFQRLAESTELTIGDTITTRRSQIEVFTVGLPVRQSTGSFDGAVVVYARPAAFRDFYQNALLGPDDVATLVRADGQMLVRVPSLDQPLIRIRRGLTEAIEENPSKGTYETQSAADGITRIYAYYKLPDYPLYVTYGISQDRLLTTWRRGLVLPGIMTAAACLLLLTIAFLQHRRAQHQHQALQIVRSEMARREKAEATLQRAERLDLLGQIAGGVAHDFNNLLMVIISGVSLAKRRFGKPESERHLDTVMDAAHRGSELTRQLLVFARQDHLKAEPIDLAAVLNSLATGMLPRSLRGDIRIELDIPEDLWPVVADPGQLEMAILNLAVNARDAMPRGGTLRLVGRNVEWQKSDESPIGRPGSFVALSVSDTGVGIPEKHLGLILEPFYTTKEPGKGTGLGLSMVHGFVTQSAGDLQISSDLGHGTTITLFLPRAQQAAQVSEEATIDMREVGHGRILLVEDSPEVADATKSILEELGFSVQHVFSAREALQGNPDAFDAVVSDIVMPGRISGIELAQTLRKRFPRLPVLLLTGHSDQADAAERAGISVLRKPCGSGALLSKLQECMSVNPAGKEHESQ